MMEPRDVFISHAEEDGEIALGLAGALREQGRSTWVYEEDAVPGISHLIQSSEAIEGCGTFLLIASPHSVQSSEVIREVEQAHQLRKVIVPVRVGLTQEQFTASNRILRMATGTAVTLAAETGDLAATATRIVGSGVPSPIATPFRRVATTFSSGRYVLVALAGVVLAAVIGAMFLKWPGSAQEPLAGSPADASASAPNAELVALLEIRAQKILEEMDADLADDTQSITSDAEAVSETRRGLVQELESTTGKQRQLFVELHRRHVEALKADQPIVANQIVADIYHLLWLRDGQRREREMRAFVKRFEENMKGVDTSVAEDAEKDAERAAREAWEARKLPRMPMYEKRAPIPGDFVKVYPALSNAASEMVVEPERIMRIEALVN